MLPYQRAESRAHDALRNVSITPHFIQTALGSCLLSFGRTRVVCTASVEEKVPPFLNNTGLGWLTAEYSMLPASSLVRIPRERGTHSGRSQEISRLIGRSLRLCLDRKVLGPRTITIDCDVIEADGGTRTAAITGGYVALALAVQKLLDSHRLVKSPIKHGIAAISVGMVRNQALLDLDYIEDSSADLDANLVATANGHIAEWQCTAEKVAVPPERIAELMQLGLSGIQTLTKLQNACLNQEGIPT